MVLCQSPARIPRTTDSTDQQMPIPHTMVARTKVHSLRLESGTAWCPKNSKMAGTAKMDTATMNPQNPNTHCTVRVSSLGALRFQMISPTTIIVQQLSRNAVIEIFDWIRLEGLKFHESESATIARPRHAAIAKSNTKCTFDWVAKSSFFIERQL